MVRLAKTHQVVRLARRGGRRRGNQVSCVLPRAAGGVSGKVGPLAFRGLLRRMAVSPFEFSVLFSELGAHLEGVGRSFVLSCQSPTEPV
jgi:hypothetical protein